MPLNNLKVQINTICVNTQLFTNKKKDRKENLIEHLVGIQGQYNPSRYL